MNVLVTGASSGIGAALARALAARGDTVGLVARREDRLDAVLVECIGSSPKSQRWVANLEDLDRAQAVALEAWDAFGGLDVLVNNAAIPQVSHVTKLTLADVERQMRVNYLSPVAMTMAVLPRMLERGSGTIVNVGSVGGRLGIGRETAYSGAKFALSGWSEALALDLWETGVNVKLVTPGAVDTEIWTHPDVEPTDYDGDKASPDDVAAEIVPFLTDDRFEICPPESQGMAAIIKGKANDVDAFLKGTAAWEAQAQARAKG
ncbi:MAG: SDR family NAD(P)-dependent oxidoreductase [Acidimicrobiia bacterium]|nr:SDR family NAD(P)-dependent oxidoreductase [Acidimicrobiia bacterium]